MARKSVYVIDLTKIEGDGSFPCPKCGALISPDDDTETVYSIVETKMRGKNLEELIIQCNVCGSRIRLIGFLSCPASQLE